MRQFGKEALVEVFKDGKQDGVECGFSADRSSYNL